MLFRKVQESQQNMLSTPLKVKKVMSRIKRFNPTRTQTKSFYREENLIHCVY